MNIHRKSFKFFMAGLVGLGTVMFFSTTNAALVTMSGPFSTPEYFGQQNYLYSPLPEICSGIDTTPSGGHCLAATKAGTLAGGLHKFVDSLPNLHVGPCAATPNIAGINNLGQCLSVAQPDITSFAARTATDMSGNVLQLPDTDYYSLELGEFAQYMHSDFMLDTLQRTPPTPLRGYRQLPTLGRPSPSSEHQYLSPFIIAAKGRPTRLKFKNSIAHEIPLPVDQSYWGAGSVDYNGTTVTAGTPTLASTRRATLHLHGGDNPWISDGTPHTWTTPTNDPTGGTGSGFQKGTSFQNVPDMVTNGWLLGAATCGAKISPINATSECFSQSLNDGMASYYYPNGQTSRLMFYHDHAFGITRLNVYQGEAAGYLLADKVQEDSLKAMGVPGWIGVDAAVGGAITGVNLGVPASDVAHIVPMVIQDKTFVPDNGYDGGQLALQDPTWPAPNNANAATDYTGPSYWLTLGGSATNGWGRGSLWLPHVYMTNQLPIAVTQDLAGNPITPSTIAPLGRWDYTPWMGAPLQINNPPVACQSTAYSVPFSCPAMKNPTATPESFMDTIIVNGTVYPYVKLSPSAYRFKILNAAGDRFFNMGLYVAVTQDPIVTIVDTTSPTPATPGMGAMADAIIVPGGVVTGFQITSPGANYPTSPILTLTGGSTGTGSAGAGTHATAYAIVDTLGAVQKAIPYDGGTGFLNNDVLADQYGNTYTVTTIGNCGANVGCITALNVTSIAPLSTPSPSVVVKVTYGVEPSDYAILQSSAPTGLGLVEATGLAAVDINGQVIDLIVDPAHPGANYIAGGTSCKDVNQNLVPLCTEVKQVWPQVYTQHSTPQLCSGTKALVPHMDNMGLVHVPDLSLGITGMSPTCWPDSWPQDGSAHSGMVPDPTYAGPPIIQLGNEGGLLPKPVIIPSTPINYVYNRKVATVLGFTGGHGLDLAPAQRADVVVDFHDFAPTGTNTTVLIAYNDHPAPAPLFDSRYDMYTGDQDQSPFGGAPTTLPGFGPNTRTMLQIRLLGSADNPRINIPTITSPSIGVPALFASTQDKIIVPQPEYPKNGLGTDGPNGYAPTYTAGTFYTVQLPNTDSGILGGINVTAGGKYAERPTVTIDPPTGGNSPAQAVAIANLVGGSVTDLGLISAGTGYTSPPQVAFNGGGGGTGASFKANLVQTAVNSVNLTSAGSGYPGSLTNINFIKDGTNTAIACLGCATVAYGVSSIVVTAGGRYASTPTVTVAPPGATATATLAATGGVVYVIPSTAPVCGAYTGTNRAVTFSGGAGSGAAATANITSGRITSVTVTLPGSNYPPTGITARINGCTGNVAGLTIGIGRALASVTITNKGSGYTTPPTVTATNGTPSPAATLTATVSGYIAPLSGANITAIQTTLNSLATATSAILTLPSASPTIPAGEVPGQVTVTRFPSTIFSFTKINGGTGYITTPTVNVTGGGGTGGQARVHMNQRSIASFSLTNPGNSYLTVPNVVVTPVVAADSYNSTDGIGANLGKGGAFFNPMVVDFKGIIEGFDPIWGTLDVTLGDSIPAPGTNVSQNYLVAAALPFGYVDPPSELVADGGVADWRIDHIGVDAHSLHFHLFNVQVINYLDIAGQIYMPDSNQLGWNEALRTEPFTSVFVALRTKKMTIPWELPNSIRPMDPTTYVSAVNGPQTPVACINNPFVLQAQVGPTCVPFAQVDPMANAVNITNALVNYGYEYVYHCHLLSHEEHDMMRPISFVVAPKNAPGLTRNNATTLKITDNSFNETNFIIERSTNGGGTWTAFASVQTGTGGTTGTGVGKTTLVTAPTVAGTIYRAKAANIVGCNASVPALSNGALPAQPAPACSDIFTGWPSMTATSPASVGAGVQ